MCHDGGTLLFAVAAGYWVVERASAQKGQLKQIGQFLGALIIVLALTGVVLSALCAPGMHGGWRKGGMCPLGSMRGSGGGLSTP